MESAHSSGLAGVEGDLIDLTFSPPTVHRAVCETLWGAHRCEARVCPPMDQSGEDTSEAETWRMTAWSVETAVVRGGFRRQLGLRVVKI